MEIEIRGNSAGERAASDPQAEFAVVHMEPPPHCRAVSVRRRYYYPFWSIERSEKRWEFDVARAEFRPGDVHAEEAHRFAERWRRKWFEGWTGGETGHVYVPLQGRLLERRSFQTCAPIEMIEAVLAHDPARRVVAGLHPKERYSEAEIAAIERLARNERRLDVRLGGVETLLPGCDYVVTQNSAVGFAGYLWHKPLVLFGRIDFHHIAARTWDVGARAAIRAAPGLTADYDGYVWWFLQEMSVNAGRPEAADRIAARLRNFGWPV